MSWFRTLTFLIFTIINTSQSRHIHHHHHHHQKKPSALVVGTVYCNTCFQQNLPRAGQHFISGASVVIECRDMGPGTSFRQLVKTDSRGKFSVHLPFSVGKHMRKIIRGCSVRLISSNEPYCAVAASATSSQLYLKSRKEGTWIFSAGFFTFRPQVCDEKLRGIEKKISQFSNPNDPAFVPPIQDPPSLGSFLPPLPRLPPLPQLPRLPPLPGLPFLPPQVPREQPASNVPKLAENLPDPLVFPPNPFNFNLPSLIFPPNPFQSPPVTIPIPIPIPPVLPLPLPPVLPPLFPTPNNNIPPLLNLPPLPQLPPLPPIPGLTTSPPPPPPPPPAPLQLPPFPFQPSPGFPGAPPAEVAAPSERNSP